MIFLLVLIRTLKNRGRGPWGVSELSESVFRDGEYP